MISTLPSGMVTPAALVLAGCGVWSGAGPGCRVSEGPRALPDVLAKTSGVAASFRNPGLYWTHSDDAGPAVLWAVDAQGHVLGEVALDGVSVFDAEDLGAARCAEGSCLYLADIGDNYGERDTLVVHRLVEPSVSATSVASQPLRMRLPDGARDAEAIFVLPGEQLFVVTKGRDHPVAVYRFPLPVRPDTVATLEELQRLSENARVLPRQVTGAAATADGSTVVIRTYETLLFHRWAGGRLVALDNGTVNLRTLREAQGEGVGSGADGVVVLTSEGGPACAPASITLLRCRIEGMS